MSTSPELTAAQEQFLERVRQSQQAAVAEAFDFAEQLLAKQREFAEQLVAAGTAPTPPAAEQ
jgi:hypothetical protein